MSYKYKVNTKKTEFFVTRRPESVAKSQKRLKISSKISN